MRLKEGKITSYLLQVVKRNTKEVLAVQAAEAGGDEGGAGSPQAGTRFARAGFMVVVKTWLVSR